MCKIRLNPFNLHDSNYVTFFQQRFKFFIMLYFPASLMVAPHNIDLSVVICYLALGKFLIKSDNT